MKETQFYEKKELNLEQDSGRVWIFFYLEGKLGSSGKNKTLNNRAFFFFKLLKLYIINVVIFKYQYKLRFLSFL